MKAPAHQFNRIPPNGLVDWGGIRLPIKFFICALIPSRNHRLFNCDIADLFDFEPSHHIPEWVSPSYPLSFYTSLYPIFRARATFTPLLQQVDPYIKD